MIPNVLFVCVHNSGRSQMAEAWFNHLAERRRIDLSARSAGTDPATTVLPLVAFVMAERGIDISLQIPNLVTDEMVLGTDQIVTMGCDIGSDRCPAIRYRHAVDWELPDPSHMGVEEIRRLRDVIYDKVEQLLSHMTLPVIQPQTQV